MISFLFQIRLGLRFVMHLCICVRDRLLDPALHIFYGCLGQGEKLLVFSQALHLLVELLGTLQLLYSKEVLG